MKKQVRKTSLPRVVSLLFTLLLDPANLVQRAQKKLLIFVEAGLILLKTSVVLSQRMSGYLDCE